MFKKLLLVVALLITSAQTMQAATFSYKPTADIYSYNAGSYSIDTNNPYLPAASNYGISIMKFDFSQELSNQIIDLTNQNIVSAQLKLYLYSSSGNNTTIAYLYNDNSWVEPALNSYKFTAVKSVSQSVALGSLTTSQFYNMQNLQEWTISLNASLITVGADNKISIALADKTVVGVPVYTPINEFASKEYTSHGVGYYSPVLTLTTSAPTPEPSSMLLGLMGLSSIIGFRKRKKK